MDPCELLGQLAGRMGLHPDTVDGLMRGIPMMPGMAFGLSDDHSTEEESDDGSEQQARPKPLDEASCRSLVDHLRDPAASIPSRVASLHRLLADLRLATQPPAAVLSETSLQTLSGLVTREWPPSGDLAASAAASDVVVALRPPLPPPPLPVWRLPHHTMRRVAAGVVAELCKWRKAVDGLHRLGFFGALPPLLRDLGARYRYGQSYRRMYGRGQRTDQGQYILERLVTAAAVAASVSSAVGRLCADYLMEPLVRFYPRLDARRAKVTARRRLRPRPEDDAHAGGPAPRDAGFAVVDVEDSSDESAEEEDLGAGISGGGGGALRWGRPMGRCAVNAEPGAEVPELEYGLGDAGAARGAGRMPRRQRRPRNMYEAVWGEGECAWRGPGEQDPLPTAFLRFMRHAWCALMPAQQEACLSGGMVAALSAFPVAPHYQTTVEGPLVSDMRDVYNRMALRSFPHVRSADSSLRAAAQQLRLRGNEAFKAGQYEAAVASYTEAVALDWDEPTHRNNRCFALLKLGRLAEARAEGGRSVGCDPRSPRCWSRLAAVYEALKQWQLAQLCYRQAQSLSRPRTDEEIQARLAEAERQLNGVQPWRFETIPGRCHFEGRRKWHAWISRHLPKAQVRALDAMTELAMADVAGTDPRSRAGAKSAAQSSVLAAASASEAYQASVTLLPLWETACAIEEAPRVPRDSSLRFNASWTDTSMRDRDTGLVYYTMSCMSAADGTQRTAGGLIQGKPRFSAIRNGFCCAIARPHMGRPARPTSIFLAHRAVPYHEQLKAFFDRMDVLIICESKHEAAQSAAHYNTDPTGYNHRDQYHDEVQQAEAEGDPQTAPGAPPPRGQAQPPSAAAAAAAAVEAADALSDDDTSASYRVMLADTVGAVSTSSGTSSGGGGGGGDGGGTAAASRPSGDAPVMPSDEQTKQAQQQRGKPSSTEHPWTDGGLAGEGDDAVE